MLYNNLSKTIAALLFSLTISSVLPVLAQSKPVKKFTTSGVRTTYTPMNTATETYGRGQGGFDAKIEIKKNPLIQGSGGVNGQGEYSKKQTYTTQSCQTNNTNVSNAYIQYKKADGTTFNMYQGQTGKPSPIASTTAPGPCPRQ
jgi:hypothetical protein